ncbi:MAG TPA: hypothetical protein VGB37_00310 [Candidatus Lokiarchaeia archaeon]
MIKSDPIPADMKKRYSKKRESSPLNGKKAEGVDIKQVNGRE